MKHWSMGRSVSTVWSCYYRYDQAGSENKKKHIAKEAKKRKKSASIVIGRKQKIYKAADEACQGSFLRLTVQRVTYALALWTG